jgi:flavin-dependent dehydrogenase
MIETGLEKFDFIIVGGGIGGTSCANSVYKNLF